MMHEERFHMMQAPLDVKLRAPDEKNPHGLCREFDQRDNVIGIDA
jgi:hypothetical protein